MPALPAGQECRGRAARGFGQRFTGRKMGGDYLSAPHFLPCLREVATMHLYHLTLQRGGAINAAVYGASVNVPARPSEKGRGS